MRNLLGKYCLIMVLLSAFLVVPYNSFSMGAGSDQYAALRDNPNAPDVLAKMADALKGIEAMDLLFEMTVTDQNGSVVGNFEGEVQSQGYAFKLLNPELEVYCDGVSKWIYNVASAELTIFPNDTTQADLVENPVGFLLSLNSGNSDFRKPGKAQYNKNPLDGRAVWSIELTPKSRYAPYKGLTICVDASDYLPSVLMYKSADDNTYTINIKSVRKLPLWPLSNFRFPEKMLPGLTVTDLR